VRATAVSIRPTDTEVASTLNHGRTTPIMMPNPAPSSPRRADCGTIASSAVIGAESLPRSPSPSNGVVAARMPGVVRGTSHSVDSSPPAVGLLDHT
jgi:hypothetical protein